MGRSMRRRLGRIVRRRAGGDDRPDSRARRGRLDVGLAIGPHAVAAVELRRTALGLRPGAAYLHRFVSDDPGPSAGGSGLGHGSGPLRSQVARLLAELMEEAGAAGGRVRVALAHPLAAAKVVSVPPVRRRDLRPLMVRNVDRYFITGGEPALVDAVRLARGGEGRSARALAVYGPRTRIREVESAVADAGLRLEGIAPAPVALLAAVRELEPSMRRGRVVVALGSDEYRLGLAMEDGRLRMIEPWGARAGPAERAGVDLARSAFSEALDDGHRSPVRLVLGGGTVTDDPDIGTGADDIGTGATAIRTVRSEALAGLDVMTAAAFGAAILPDDAPQLLPESSRAGRARRVWHRRCAIAGVAALLLAAAGALQLWGLDRELRAVAAERRAIAPQVARASEQREALDAIHSRIAAITGVEEGRVRWSSALGALAHALPDSAYLFSVTADGVRVRVAGISRAAASSIVPALEASPYLSEVALATAEQAESRDGERFDLTVAFGSTLDPSTEGDEGS